MAEQYPSDTTLNALSGSSDDEQGVLFLTIAESPYYTNFYKMLYRLLDVARRAGDLRVFKDGDLTFGVRAGLYMNGDTPVSFAETTAESLDDDDTTYIYLTATGTLTTNVTGFPDPSTTPHVPLATIAVGSDSTAAISGEYNHEDITDYRGRAIMATLSSATAANANTLVDGSNADALHIHAAAGLTAAVQDDIPDLNVTFGAEAGDEIVITAQVRDAADNNLAERMAIRVWVATTDFGAPDATDNTVAIDTGTILQTVTANAFYDLISDAAGKVEVGVTVAGAATRYVMAEIDGRIYSSGVITWAA